MNKRLLTLAASFLCTLFTFAQFSGSGSGTASDPYLIFNPIQLDQIRNFLNRTVYFKLMSDIDLTEFIEDESPSAGWVPIGSSSSSTFKGVIDGNGKTISGLRIKRQSSDYQGFLGYATNATIKNLSLENVNIVGNSYVGAIVGNGSNCAIENCTITGCVKGSGYVGGVGGQVSGTIKKVYSTVDVTGTGKYYVGGIAGRSACETISDCCVKANVAGNTNVGGIIGRGSDDIRGDIIRCIVIGNITGTGDYVGGIAGYSYESIGSCNFCGSVIGQKHTGGVAGTLLYMGIARCLVEGSISGSGGVGGICGTTNNGSISHNVVIATKINVEENGSFGRICAYAPSASDNIAYNQTKVIKEGVIQEITDDAQNGSGVSKNKLMLKATYVALGWNFTSVWAIQETESYPYLQLQTAPPIITSELISGATTVSGNCEGNCFVTLELDGTQQGKKITGNAFSFTVSPLQAGHEVRVFAQVEGKAPSRYTTKKVGYIGSGTEADPYKIYTASDLACIYQEGYFQLMNDINLTNYINQFSPTKGWVPIGDETIDNVHFNGNGYTISGLWSKATSDNTGLFSSLANGTIKNLTLKTAVGKMVKGGSNTGILIGKLLNGTIENCQVTGSVSGGSSIGGFVGFMNGGKINHCESSVTVTSQGDNAFVGGLVGDVENGTISKCKSEVTLTATGANSYIGGLIGNMVKGSISQCYTKGTMTGSGTQSYIGGLIGKNAATITNCYSTADINSSYNAGGLVAYNYAVVEKCYATGNLHSNNYAAGIIGYNDGTKAVVKNCVAMNNIIDVVYESQQTQQGGGYGQRIIGGLKNNAPTPELNNYALETIQMSVNNIPQNVYDDVMNGIAKPAAELMSAATYQGVGWNFSSVWGIDEGVSYPFLQWENEITPVTGISLDKTTLSMEEGQGATITASVTPQNATYKQLSWTSSNESVATVENGVVTAVAVGTATITVAATDGSGVTATCQVTVTISKEAAIAALQELVAEAQTLYDNSTEGENIGDYAPGSRAALLAVINNVNAQISSTMSDEAISQCTEDITAAIAEFQNQQVTAGEDTDYSTIANTIYLERVEAAAGSQVTLSVKMKNTVEVQGYQFDLYLPEGVTVATDEDRAAIDARALTAPD